MRSLELVEPDDEVHADYVGRFAAHNAEASGWTVETFSIVLRHEDGRVGAGGRGRVYLGMLEVQGLWVDADLRGDGTGSGLLRAIEAEGRRRGAAKAWLYTYSWQAEPFYRAHGYTPFARLDFPQGHARIEMQKTL